MSLFRSNWPQQCPIHLKILQDRQEPKLRMQRSARSKCIRTVPSWDVQESVMKFGTQTEKWSGVKENEGSPLDCTNAFQNLQKKAFNARCFQYFFGANFCFFFLSKILLNMFSHRLTSTWLSNANRLAPRCKGIHQPRDKHMDRNPPCRPYCLHYASCGRNAKITSQFLPKRLTTGFAQAKHVLRVIYSLRAFP